MLETCQGLQSLKPHVTSLSLITVQWDLVLTSSTFGRWQSSFEILLGVSSLETPGLLYPPRLLFLMTLQQISIAEKCLFDTQLLHITGLPLDLRLICKDENKS